MVIGRRSILWSRFASERHDQTAFDIALQYGEQAAFTYLDGIAQALGIIARHPRIGRRIFPYLANRHRHVTSRGWEVYYDDDHSNRRIIVIDIQRAPSTSRR